jgi:hypothetical protein
MPCLELPEIAISLPSPLSLPSLGLQITFGDPSFCCTFKLPAQIPPIVLPPGILNPATIAVLNTLIDSYLDVLKQVPKLECPKGL